MKYLKFILYFGLCIVATQSLLATSITCDPDLSIENQKSKKISHESKILLAGLMKDKVDLMWPIQVCKCWISSLS